MDIRNRYELIIMRFARWAGWLYESADSADRYIAILEQRVKVDQLRRKLAKAYDPFWRRELADARNELYRMEREARGEEL